MKYTKIPSTAFQTLQLGAGILLRSFDPATAEITEGSLLGATTGGVDFSAKPSFSDFGEDIDNCPKNMAELKRLDAWEAELSGTFVTIDPALAQRLLGSADTDGPKITPRNDLVSGDFTEIWWVGDYSDRNSDASGGYVAIHLKRALSTDGFQLKTGDKSKGSFPFAFTAHYTMQDQDEVPFEIYVQAGEES